MSRLHQLHPRSSDQELDLLVTHHEHEAHPEVDRLIKIGHHPKYSDLSQYSKQRPINHFNINHPDHTLNDSTCSHSYAGDQPIMLD
ncbi:hypothetical protein PGTUg99_037674 [Puccinia graminis f. sp. tritici]|uniref:Uncharacterized protein n=1 Tax=Puccinia graminis f. sp. tritici TaxID=56615 RepID=A0A5B0RAX0_PUCGR|nr:hypothetical protein PGTUg99_037674 [Puccinia graminis f. sp. tritici]